MATTRRIRKTRDYYIQEKRKASDKIKELKQRKSCGRSEECICRKCMGAMRASYRIEQLEKSIERINRKLANEDFDAEEKASYSIRLKPNMKVSYNGIDGRITTIIDKNTCYISIPGGEVPVDDARNVLKAR